MNMFDKVFEMIFRIIIFIDKITSVFIVNFILYILFLLPLTLTVFFLIKIINIEHHYML